MTIEKIIKHLEYLKIAAEIDAKPESINAEIIGAAIQVIKERLTYEALAMVCVDNALRAAKIEIAGEDEMSIMEFMDRVSNGEYYIIRAKDNEIKPLPYEGEEEIKRAYDRGYNQACKDKIESPYKEEKK